MPYLSFTFTWWKLCILIFFLFATFLHVTSRPNASNGQQVPSPAPLVFSNQFFFCFLGGKQGRNLNRSSISPVLLSSFPSSICSPIHPPGWLSLSPGWLPQPKKGGQIDKWMNRWKIFLFYRTLPSIGAAAQKGIFYWLRPCNSISHFLDLFVYCFKLLP